MSWLEVSRDLAGWCLLDWLSQHGTDLSALTQDQLDQWLLAEPGRHTPIQPFISWTVRHKITRDVDVKGRPAAAPAGFLDDREQARQLRTCLNDTGIPVVGEPVPVAQLAQITDGNKGQGAGGCLVGIGDAPLDDPRSSQPPLGQ